MIPLLRAAEARWAAMVSPLRDETPSREDPIARHPLGEFRMVERRIRMDWAQDSGMQFRLNSCFHGVGNHEIRLPLGQRIEDRGVVAPLDDRRHPARLAVLRTYDLRVIGVAY